MRNVVVKRQTFAGWSQALKSAWISVECLKGAWFLILPWKWWFFLEKCLKMTVLSLKNKTSRYFVLFCVALPQIIINYSYFNEKKKTQKMSKKAIFIYPFWLICDLTVNCMEIQDFVQLPCISLLWYTWNDHENVLENCENVLEKCLNFFWKPVLTMICLAMLCNPL